ncbi:hypothetical protein AUR66_16610, partial [Haloferax profundi]
MKLKPGGAKDWTDPFEFCREEEVVGVGWGLSGDSYETVGDIHKALQEKKSRRAEEGKGTEEILSDGRLNAPLRYMFKEMDIGDYVWVNKKNRFGLCRIKGDWEIIQNLSDNDAERYAPRDIKNFRPVDWVDVPYSLVPGYVRRKFSGQTGTAFEMDDGINEESKHAIRAIHAHENLDVDSELPRQEIADKISRAEIDRIFDILGPSETEDVVISYLQSKGWRIIKSSTGGSQADVECEMLTEEDGESTLGYLQVKTGSAGVNPESYKKYAD